MKAKADVSCFAWRMNVYLDRLTRLSDGREVYRLKRPWCDGTTDVIFEPQDFMSMAMAVALGTDRQEWNAIVDWGKQGKRQVSGTVVYEDRLVDDGRIWTVKTTSVFPNGVEQTEKREIKGPVAFVAPTGVQARDAFERMLSSKCRLGETNSRKGA